jgi:hypothetical protein
MRSAALALVAACAPSAGPVLDEVTPAAARGGVHVTLTGTGLCPDAVAGADGNCDPLPSGAVDFGLDPPIVRGLVVAWRPTSITVEVPTTQVAIGATIVYVTVDGRSSNGLHFEVLP